MDGPWGYIPQMPPQPPRHLPIADRNHPINVDSDSDDDVIILSRPPTPPKRKEIPRQWIEIGQVRINIPQIPEEIVRAYKDAVRIAPEMTAARADAFLDEVLRSDNPVDNLLDRLIMAGTNPQTIVSGNHERESTDVLAALVPTTYRENVKSEIKKSGFLGAYRELRRNPPQRQMKGRRSVPPLSVTSIPLAIDLMDLNAEAQKELQARQKEIEFQRAKEKGELLTCECCYLSFLDQDMTQCQAGHLFCKGCLTTCLETFMASGRTDLKCLSYEAECEALIPMSELERSVPKRTLERWIATETDAAVVNSDIQGLVKCHHCGIRIEVDGSGVMRCPECGSDTCTGCGEAAHTGMSCEEFAAIDKGRIVEDHMSEAVIRTCPKCHARFMKEEGCNKMECPVCHTWICYLCRKEIPKDVGYAHFWRSNQPCPPNRCPLWVRNETLHRIEAVQARERKQADLQ